MWYFLDWSRRSRVVTIARFHYGPGMMRVFRSLAGGTLIVTGQTRKKAAAGLLPLERLHRIGFEIHIERVRAQQQLDPLLRPAIGQHHHHAAAGIAERNG